MARALPPRGGEDPSGLRGSRPVGRAHRFDVGAWARRQAHSGHPPRGRGLRRGGHLLLRDRLRQNQGDRELYAQTKRELAKRDWPDMEHYAEAKTEVVEDIVSRATAARSWPDGLR